MSKMNIAISKTTQLNEVTELSKEHSLVPFTVNKTIKVKGFKQQVSCNNYIKAYDGLSLIILHKIIKKELDINELLSIVQFDAKDVAKRMEILLQGRYKPGVTKVGFGPFHALNIFENITVKGDSDVCAIRNLLLLSSIHPFVRVEGLEMFVVNGDYSEIEVPLQRLNDVIKAAKILQCVKHCILLSEEKKKTIRKDAFFQIEDWILFLRTIKNVIMTEADKTELFDEAINEVAVLALAYLIGIRTKGMLIYDELLNSNQVKSLLSIQQLSEKGFSNIKGLPTLLLNNLGVETLKFHINIVFESLIGNENLEISEFELSEGEIITFCDLNLKGQLKGSSILASPYVERPIQVLKRLEASKGYFSFSNDGFATVGKRISDYANALLSLTLSYDLVDCSDHKCFALERHYSNLDEETMRKILMWKDPHSVYLFIPETVRDDASDTILTDELEKVRFVYKLNSSLDYLEYEAATGFRVLGSLFLVHPYLPLLSALNKNKERKSVLSGKREKSVFFKMSYDTCYLRDISTYSVDNVNQENTVSVTEDGFSSSFVYNARELIKLSTAGSYKLDVDHYANALKIKESIANEIINIFKQDAFDRYGSITKEEDFESERQYAAFKNKVKDSMLLREIADRVKKTVQQNFIDVNGTYDETLSAMTLNTIMNRTLLEVFEQELQYILGPDFEVNREVKNSKYLSMHYLGGLDVEINN